MRRTNCIRRESLSNETQQRRRRAGPLTQNDKFVTKPSRRLPLCSDIQTRSQDFAFTLSALNSIDATGSQNVNLLEELNPRVALKYFAIAAAIGLRIY